MAIISEEITSNILDARIQVLTRQTGEYYSAWEIISLEIDDMERCTPKQLKRLGEWMAKEADRIQKQYNAAGQKQSNK